MANIEKETNPTVLQTNISVIDEGHLKLSEIHNHVKLLLKQEANKNDLAEAFFSLSYFFENYLLKEELLLKSKGYPNFDDHKASHSSFIKGIEHLKDSYENDIKCTLKELDTFIGDWLKTHSLNYNKEVVDFLNKK